MTVKEVNLGRGPAKSSMVICYTCTDMLAPKFWPDTVQKWLSARGNVALLHLRTEKPGPAADRLVAAMHDDDVHLGNGEVVIVTASTPFKGDALVGYSTDGMIESGRRAFPR